MIYKDVDLREDKPGEECGVFGIYDKYGHDCADMVYYGLYALQHRGQESCGIVVNDNREISYKKGMGLVTDQFNGEVLASLKGNIGVGHVRYSTTGESRWENSQPLVSRYVKGTLVIAHNGNLVNAQELRQEYEMTGAIFQSTTDSEVLAYAIARARIQCGSIEEAVQKACRVVKGAFSLIIMSPEKLIAARDPLGMRPLVMGKIGQSVVFASETCALDAIGAEYVRDVEPGEVIVVDKNGTRFLKENCGQAGSRMCIFEYIYFARPDSIIEGQSVYDSRLEAGRILAQKHPVDADIVVGVPDSGLCAALGYARESGIPYADGFIKNRYVGRTFIQPKQSQREMAVRIKLNPISAVVSGKKVVMIDDSIVRGTTCGRIVNLLKLAGAKEVHVRISSPPFLWPCFFGTDIPSRDKLISCHHSIEQTRRIIGADSLGYLDIEDMPKLIPNAKCGFCDACFSKNYPMDVGEIR
ncbi:MAG: amidophosphoribosyltransferase [Eubacteriales bacterium]|jgi:amidophosphoribosyltransferase